MSPITLVRLAEPVASQLVAVVVLSHLVGMNDSQGCNFRLNRLRHQSSRIFKPGLQWKRRSGSTRSVSRQTERSNGRLLNLSVTKNRPYLLIRILRLRLAFWGIPI